MYDMKNVRFNLNVFWIRNISRNVNLYLNVIDSRMLFTIQQLTVSLKLGLLAVEVCV